jgi:hypothetical protein
MFDLVVMDVMTLSGHLSNINEISIHKMQQFSLKPIHFIYKIKLFLYPGVRNPITHLTIMLVFDQIQSIQSHIKTTSRHV